MIRLLVYFFLFYIGFKILKKLFAVERKTVTTANSPLDGEETVKDPVCGMYLAKKDAITGKLDGKWHYFCSIDCLNKFQGKLEEPKQK